MVVIINVSETTTGATGFQGPTGFQGAQGITGELGITGDQGAQGITGFQGAQGITGELGITGDQGAQGPIGFQGTTGFQGEQGTTGFQGEQGPIGAQGPTGFQGEQGTTGLQGAQGPIGAQGPTGFQGAQGITGLQGAQGPIGAQGPTGDQGEMGPQGTTGDQGPIGEQGPTGNQGPAGNQGPVGSQGITGPMGITGYAGVAGVGGSALLTVGPSGTFQTMQVAMSYLQTNTILDATVYLDQSLETGSFSIGMTGTNIVVVGGIIGQNGSSISLGGNISFIGTRFTAPATAVPTFVSSTNTVLNFIDCDIQLRNDVSEPLVLGVTSSSTEAGALSITNCNIDRSYGSGSPGGGSNTSIHLYGAGSTTMPSSITIDGCTLNTTTTSDPCSTFNFMIISDGSTIPSLANIKNNTIGINGSFTNSPTCRSFFCSGINKIYTFDSNLVTVRATGIPAGSSYMIYDSNGNATRCSITILNGIFLTPSTSDKVVFVPSPVTTYRVVCSNLSTNAVVGTAFTVDGTSFFTPSTITTDTLYSI